MGEAEVFRGHRRRAGWRQVTYGAHAADGCHPLLAWQLVLPGSGRFTHLTAATVLGWWVPPIPVGFPVVVAVDRADTRPRRPGLHVVRTDPVVPPQSVRGLRLDGPAEVLLACARHLLVTWGFSTCWC